MRMEINYGKLIFIPENKINISLENNLDITIEDKHYKINKISTKMKKYKDGCDNVPFLTNLCNHLLAPDVA